MSKGQQTRSTILSEAMRAASVEGFQGISIGMLAERLGMSKSGLFAHFGSKEELEKAVLDETVASLGEIMNLKIGSQIMLNVGPDAMVELRCGDGSTGQSVIEEITKR